MHVKVIHCEAKIGMGVMFQHIATSFRGVLHEWLEIGSKTQVARDPCVKADM
jgi:serine acetyltransferase